MITPKCFIFGSIFALNLLPLFLEFEMYLFNHNQVFKEGRWYGLRPPNYIGSLFNV